MLTYDREIYGHWCLDESDMVYWYTNQYTLNKLARPFGSKKFFDSGKNILLGPVCLGFWRG
jgi:hypothetical protein